MMLIEERIFCSSPVQNSTLGNNTKIQSNHVDPFIELFEPPRQKDVIENDTIFEAEFELE